MPDQAYYWTPEWQATEAEAVVELLRGDGRRFDNPAEAIAWLTSDDDD